MEKLVIELEVQNHSGVMSHITGLFARRAFNLEGILCASIGNERSRVILLVEHQKSLHQIITQLEKLYDVYSVYVKNDFKHEMLDDIAKL